MNRVSLGVICGVVFGTADVLITIPGSHPGPEPHDMLQAISSRFAIGLLTTAIELPLHPVLA